MSNGPEILCDLIKLNETGPEKEFTLSLFSNSNFNRWGHLTPASVYFAYLSCLTQSVFRKMIAKML